MKTKLFYRISGLLLFGIFGSQAFAQEKDTVRMDTLPTLTITRTSIVDKKVSEAFKKAFKDAQDPHWYRYTKNYLVSFISKDQRNNALYSHKGSIIYHISYGRSEKDLPFDVARDVKSEYPDYTVRTAIHVRQAGRSIWIVNLEGNDIVVARSEGGELQEVERIRKSSR